MDGLGVQRDLMGADWTHRISHDIHIVVQILPNVSYTLLAVECYFDQDI